MTAMVSSYVNVSGDKTGTVAMATITQRDSGRWQAKVRKFGGKTASKTFATKTAAATWAKLQETDIERGIWRNHSTADRTSLSRLLEDYQREVVAGRRSAQAPELSRIARLKEDLGHFRLSSLTPTVLVTWRDDRLRAVAPSTVARELSTLGGALSWARKDRMIALPENAVAAIRRPSADRARSRRLESGEEVALLAALESVAAPVRGKQRGGNYQVGSRSRWLKSIVQLALETAMRQGELVALLWPDVDLENQTAHLDLTKNGDARTVPLSLRAVAILDALPREGERVFPISSEALKQSWQRAVKRARLSYVAECQRTGSEVSSAFLVDLRFHDLRHEAASRLAERLPNLIELAAVTGHRDLRMLKRYYHPRATDLAKKLG